MAWAIWGKCVLNLNEFHCVPFPDLEFTPFKGGQFRLATLQFCGVSSLAIPILQIRFMWIRIMQIRAIWISVTLIRMHESPVLVKGSSQGATANRLGLLACTWGQGPLSDFLFMAFPPQFYGPIYQSQKNCMTGAESLFSRNLSWAGDIPVTPLSPHHHTETWYLNLQHHFCWCAIPGAWHLLSGAQTVGCLCKSDVGSSMSLTCT